MTLSLDNESWKQLADEHRYWLSAFDPQYRSNWEKMLNADSEAALCEAGVRRRLERSGVRVEPNESLTGKDRAPDFRCFSDRDHFYVEVTCISIATAERRSDIKPEPSGFSPFNPWGMVEAVFAECKNKAPQCANLDRPALVAVGTFHTTAAMIGLKKVLVEGLLTGKTVMAWDVDDRTGQQAGDAYRFTEMRAAAFLQSDPTHEFRFARNSISGVLILGLGSSPGRCLGVLHPNPVRPFDPTLLADIEFGSVEIDEKQGQLRIRWASGSDE
jgi:hypothetical protein